MQVLAYHHAQIRADSLSSPQLASRSAMKTRRKRRRKSLCQLYQDDLQMPERSWHNGRPVAVEQNQAKPPDKDSCLPAYYFFVQKKPLSHPWNHKHSDTDELPPTS